MKIKQNILLYIGISLIFLLMFVGNAASNGVSNGVAPIDFEKYTLGMDGVWYDADVLGPDTPEIPLNSLVK